MSAKYNSLIIPEAAVNDENSREVLRTLVAENEMYFFYEFGQWPIDVFFGGGSDILRQIVVEEVENKTDPKQAVRLIMNKFMDEVNQFGQVLGFEECNT